MPSDYIDRGLGSSRLVVPETFLPVQHFNSLARQSEPERRLLMAVLADAINCFQKDPLSGGRSKQRDAREAHMWLMSDDKAWPFSFVNVCDSLGLDSANLRQGLLRWHRGHMRVHLKPSARYVRRVVRGDEDQSIEGLSS